MATAVRPSSRLRSLAGGGAEGNERLTTATGLLLIALMAVLGVTIIRIGQLLWLHLFLGLFLLGPVLLKMLSTWYRFVRYYTSDGPYRLKGPPPPVLRGLAPFVVLSTIAVFATGVVLLILGPGSRQPWVLIHKVAFIGWIVVTALHVLGHLPEILRLLGSVRRPAVESGDLLAGRAGRWISVASALALGLVLAVVLVPQFSPWTH
jgi:hypothetical protein